MNQNENETENSGSRVQEVQEFKGFKGFTGLQA